MFEVFLIFCNVSLLSACFVMIVLHFGGLKTMSRLEDMKADFVGWCGDVKLHTAEVLKASEGVRKHCHEVLAYAEKVRIENEELISFLRDFKETYEKECAAHEDKEGSLNV